MNISAADTHKTAQLLAAELCDKSHTWIYVAPKLPDGEALWHSATIRRDDGLELNISTQHGNGAKPGQFRIYQAYRTAAWTDARGESVDPTGHGESLPAINVSAKKTPAQLGRDVTRRLLDDAERFHDAALTTLLRRNEAHRKQDSACRMLGIAPALESDRGRAEPYSYRSTDDGATAQIRVSTDGTVNLELSSLPVGKAAAILDLLGIDRPAWVPGWEVRRGDDALCVEIVDYIDGDTETKVWARTRKRLAVRTGRKVARNDFTITRQRPVEK